MTCRVLVADCPWKFGDKLPGPKRGADKFYPTLTVWDLMRFPLPAFADDVTMFFWRVASMQREALAVIEAWGFSDPKGELVWRKQTKHGKRFIGMGRRVRGEHETALICVRGTPGVEDHSIRSVFDAPVGRHSKKPDKFYEIVEKLCGQPTPATHVELFARSPRTGWATYGNELEQAHPEAA